MNKTAITSPELAPPAGPFSQAIEVGGFLYFSGQVGQDPATGKVVEGGIVAETESIFRNLSAVLKAAGKSFDHVARAGVYLTNMSDFVAMNGSTQSISVSPFPPARRSRWPRCRLGPALRSTSSSARFWRDGLSPFDPEGVLIGRRSEIEGEARKSGGVATSVSVGGATTYIARC